MKQKPASKPSLENQKLVKATYDNGKMMIQEAISLGSKIKKLSNGDLDRQTIKSILVHCIKKDLLRLVILSMIGLVLRKK